MSVHTYKSIQLKSFNQMETKNLKVVTTTLSKESVTITVSAGGDVCVIDLPVRLIDPEISLRLAGAISSSPKFPYDANTESN